MSDWSEPEIDFNIAENFVAGYIPLKLLFTIYNK